MGQNDPEREPVEARLLYGGPRMSGRLPSTEGTRR